MSFNAFAAVEISIEEKGVMPRKNEITSRILWKDHIFSCSVRGLAAVDAGSDSSLGYLADQREVYFHA